MSQPIQTGDVPIWRDLLESVVLAVVLAAVLRFFIIQPFYIPSASMEPTLFVNDRIIVNMLLYRFSPPKRGDIIVFRYPVDPSRDFIKRVVALEGETVEVKQGYLFVNGRRLDEPYLPKQAMSDFAPKKVPPGNFFVMGDNRNNSDDSRVWGPLPRQNIIGKAFVIFWPPGRMRIIS